MSMKCNILVVDSGPLIKSSAALSSLATEFITVPEVFKELRDKATREAMATLPYTIREKAPSEEAIKEVVQFSKQTGDFGSLSLVDIKVLALTLQLQWENVGRDFAAIVAVEKKKKRTRRKKTNPLDMGGLSLKEDVEEEGNNDDDEATSVTEEKKKEVVVVEEEEKRMEVILEKEEEVVHDVPENLSSDDEDTSEWITPSNFAQKKQINLYGEASNDTTANKIVKVACVTNDFAMQNVLLQMKLSLLSVDGLLITRLKTWILRCHACFKTTSIMDKVFCPSCGNSTLIRTSVVVNKDKTKSIFLKKNFQYHNRGTVYSIPAPKGGRSSNELILREDQKEHQKALMMKQRYEKKTFQEESGLTLDSLSLSFALGRSTSTGSPLIGYGRTNPNEVRGRRRK